MKNVTLICLLGIWFTLESFATGQVESFPKPPPLAPPEEPSSGQAASSPAGNSTTPGDTTPASTTGTTEGSPSAPGATPAATTKSAPMSAATLTSMEALDDKTPLQDGDTISFRVIEDRDDAVTRIVTDTGEVDFPYVGRLKVEGKTCHEVAVELKRLLEVDYYKRATVIVGLDVIFGQEKTKFDLAWVIGEVRSEGPQQLSKLQPMTVSQIILRAGGFSEYADQRKVRIIHRSSLSSASAPTPPPDISNSKDGEVIDVKAVFDGKSSVDPVVKPDDYVIVPKRFVNI